MAEVSSDGPARGAASIVLREALEAHGDRLLRSAYLLCGNETDAQDLVQETFLQALKSSDRFRGASSVYTWLHGILRNVCHRYLRHHKRLVPQEDPGRSELCQPTLADSSDQEYYAAKLAQALQKLSPEHREVIVLRYYENLRIREIASQTGVSGGTVKSRLHYAMRCLEQLVPDELNLLATEGTHQKTSQ